MIDKNYEENSFIIFQIARVDYGIRSKLVLRMEMVENITPVPNSPPYVEGVILSRGKVVPVINIRVRFGLEKIPCDLKTRVIIININERLVGLLVDSAREYISIPSEKIQSQLDSFSGISGRFLEGIANLDGRLILILNVEEVLKSSEEILTQGGKE